MSTPAAAAAARGQRLGPILILALAVRVLHLSFVATTPVLSYHRIFPASDMYMFDQWAHRILAGDVIGRERFHYLYQWQLATAPVEKWTEWYGRAPTYYKAPFYPYLVALLERLFGDPAVPMALLQIAASLAAIVLLYRIAADAFGDDAAMWAAFAFALYGPAVHFDALLLRGPWIVLTALFLTQRLQMLRQRAVVTQALVTGMAMGALVVVNEGFAPTFVLAAATIGAWAGSWRRALPLLGAFTGGTAGVLVPIVVRNAVVGAPLFKLAVTGSIVYAVFNTAGASPYFFEIRPQNYLPAIGAAGGGLVETAIACLRTFDGPWAGVSFYLQKAIGLLIPWENPDNVNYYYVALRSPILSALPGYGVLLPLAIVGFAVAAGRRLAALVPLAPATVSLLTAILLTLPLARYRATLAVFLMPLAGLALAFGVDCIRRRRLAVLSLAIAGFLAVASAAAGLQAFVVFAGRPAGLHLYRPAEFELGVRFDEEHGRLGEATREALDLARLNPDAWIKAQALLVAGRLEARQGHEAAAREALAGAVVFGSREPGTLLAAGDLYQQALGDVAAATAAYRAAEALPGPEPVRDEIQRRLRLLEGRAGVK